MHMIDSKQELLRHHVSAASSSSQKAMFQHRCWWFCWFIEPVTFAPWTFKSGKSPQIGLHSSTSQSVLGKTRCDKCFSCLWYNFVFECCWMKQNLAKICSQEGIDLFSIGFCANLLQTLGNVTRNDTKSSATCTGVSLKLVQRHGWSKPRDFVECLGALHLKLKLCGLKCLSLHSSLHS